MPCSPLCTSYLWVEFEGRTFTLITFRNERVNVLNFAHIRFVIIFFCLEDFQTTVGSEFVFKVVGANVCVHCTNFFYEY